MKKDSRIDTAKGRYHSRLFTLLIIFLASLFLGSNSIDLLPRALGPASATPLYTATIFPLLKWLAICLDDMF